MTEKGSFTDRWALLVNILSFTKQIRFNIEFYVRPQNVYEEAIAPRKLWANLEYEPQEAHRDAPKFSIILTIESKMVNKILMTFINLFQTCVINVTIFRFEPNHMPLKYRCQMKITNRIRYA